MRNTITGMPTVPIRPIGSRAKILISSQVNFSSAFIMRARQFPTPRLQPPKHRFGKNWKLGIGSWELGVGSWELGVDIVLLADGMPRQCQKDVLEVRQLRSEVG